ncbi:MAG: RepB family plasmid replication initiator protein, partial [Brevundimonas sp.]
MNNDNQRESRPFRGEIVKKSNVLNEGIHLLDTAEKYKLFYLMIAQIAMQDKMPDSPVDIFNREYSFYLNDYADMKGIKDKYSFEEYVGKFLSIQREGRQPGRPLAAAVMLKQHVARAAVEAGRRGRMRIGEASHPVHRAE